MNGIIVINKPKGCTSHDVVYKVKKIIDAKVGHTGTLDPNATGVLPLLLGKGTQLSKYLINHDKTYEVVLKLGEKTDTADSEGKVIAKKEVLDEKLNEKIVLQTLQNYIGKQEQIPPMYSAIKVKGKKLYEYARKGENIEVEPRKIEIYSINLICINKEQNEIHFKVSCSKGTYIRSLCEDIAEKLGTVGYMKELNRTVVGQFTINDAITIEQLENNYLNENFIEQHFISIENFFENKVKLVLDNIALNRFLNGVKLKYSLENEIYRIYNKENQFIGTGIISENLLKRDLIEIDTFETFGDKSKKFVTKSLQSSKK